jgi:hypothetical protein
LLALRSRRPHTSRAAALAVECPACRVAAGDPCRTKSGEGHRRSCHAERHELAISRGAPQIWHGQHVVVWPGGRWEFEHCVRCRKRLNDGASRKGGYHADCSRLVGSAALREFDREQALEEDRAKWRLEHPRG